MAPDGRLLALVGPTASGKTELSLRIAQRYDGEIICADSRTIYRGMDIGTAKPSLKERMTVPHHLLDIIDPDQYYSAAQFQQDATAIIAEIRARHSLPLIVGGSGLYVNALLYDYQFPAGSSASLRAELSAVPLAELVQRLQQQDPERAVEIDLSNMRRVIRALETVGRPRIAPKALPQGTYIIGINPGISELRKRIRARVEKMVQQGLLAEVERLCGRYEATAPGMTSPAYRTFRAVVEGRMNVDEATEQFIIADGQLAKRQITWFKRNPDINWVATVEAGEHLAERFFAKPL